MPVTVESVEAEACTGDAATVSASRKMRRLASRLVTPRLRTVTGPCVPWVWETLVASNTRSNTALSEEGTKSSRTLPLVRPVPRICVPRTTSLTGPVWSTGRLTAPDSNSSPTSIWTFGCDTAPRTLAISEPACPDSESRSSSGGTGASISLFPVAEAENRAEARESSRLL